MKTQLSCLTFTSKQQAVKSLRAALFSHKQIGMMLGISKQCVWKHETTTHVVKEAPITLTDRDIDCIARLTINGEMIGKPHGRPPKIKPSV